MSVDRKTPAPQLPGLAALPCGNHEARIGSLEQRTEVAEQDIVRAAERAASAARLHAVTETRLEALAPLPERVEALHRDVIRITTRGATLAAVLGLLVPVLTAALVWMLGVR